MTSLVKKFSKGVVGATAAAQLMVGSAMAQTITPIDAPTGFFDDIGETINKVLQFVFVIAVLLVFMYIVWGGITWITSGGDKGKTEEARNKITAAVVGLIILLASFAILQLVVRFFTGGSDFNAVLNQVAK